MAQSAPLLQRLDSQLQLGSMIKKRLCFFLLMNLCINSDLDAIEISHYEGIVMRTMETMHARRDLETVNCANQVIFHICRAMRMQLESEPD